jgi:hypothetical protein
VPYLSDFGLATGAGSELSDQSAVGRMLWACLTGVATGTAPIGAGTGPTDDPEINRVIQRALSVDPAARYADVSELKAAVDRIGGISEEPPAAAPVLAPAPAPPPAAIEPVRPEPTLYRSQDIVEPAPAEPAPGEPAPGEAAPVAHAGRPVPPPPPTAAALLPSSPGSWPMAWPALPSQQEQKRRWWPAAIAAVVVLLVIGAVAFAVTRSGGGSAPQAAAPSTAVTPTLSATPTPSSTLSAVAPTPSPSPTAAPSAPPPAHPKPSIGKLTRSNAACTGTVGDYQKWQYALTGFKPGRVLRPQLSIRSDHGNGETTGKPVTVSKRGTGMGDFCVPAGTRGTVTITVADTSAKRQIG